MSVQIFGYGSLLNLESVRGTAPGVEALRPSFIRGFVRDFSVWDDLAIAPYCAVDISTVEDPRHQVNGVLFEVNQAYLDALMRREEGYQLIETLAYDFNSNQPIGDCLVFSSNKRDGNFSFNDPAQMRYLDVCLEGASSHGQKFYDQFIATTYIGDRALANFPDMLKTIPSISQAA